MGIGGATEIAIVTLFLSRLVERWAGSSVKSKVQHINYRKKELCVTFVTKLIVRPSPRCNALRLN